MRPVAGGLVAALVAGAGLAAQAPATAPPNLNGSWVGVPGASTPESLPTPPIQIVQNPSTLTVVRRDGSRSTYALDGRETTEQIQLSDGTTGPETSTANWNGETLVITMRSKARVRQHEYSLDDQGRLIFVSETSLLSTDRDGKLAVRTIGRFIRVYRRTNF